jgi:hypothetical protein
MNFSMYNASTVIKANPSITEFLGRDYPVTFERASDTGEFVEVDDADGEE